ncbi:MAG: hypothetical protein WC175_06090, partial [Candidatus Dojkabacteria bacterium]
MDILQTKGIFDKNQKLLDFINKLVIKNEFFANSYESEEASLLYQKISALRAGTYNLSSDERVSFINYLEDMKTNHFSDIEYFLTDSNVQYSDLIFSIPPGSESDNGTFLYFVEKGLVYQKELLKKSTYTNILMTGKTYFYYYDENGKIVRVRTEYSKQKDFENKDVFILGKSPNSYSHISNNDIEAGNFIKEYETPLIRVGLNDYPYYFSRLFRHDETSGRLEVFDGYLDDNETLRTQGILTELYGVPKFPYFSIKIKDANSFRVLIEGSIVRWVRNLRDDYPFKTLQEFKAAVSEEYQYSGYPFKNFLVFLGDREYVLSIEYIYENFYKPVSDEDILITDSEGDLIEDEDNGVYANFLTHPHLSLFNTVHGVVEYFPIDKGEINPALSDDLYVRITLKDGTYLEEPNTYKNGTEATIFSLYNFYSFLSQYFFNIPTMSIDNKDGVPDLYADISHMSLQIEVSGEAYTPKILYAYLKTNSLSYSFIIYCKNSTDNSWRKITVPEDKVTFNSQDHVYNLILDNIDLLFVMNESYYGYVLNKVEYIDKEVLLVNTLVKRSNTLEYCISGDEVAETLTNISDPIRFMTIKEDPILGSMEDEIEWLTVEDRKYKFELCRVYRDGREDETELLYNSSESENVNLFELEISGHTVSNYSEGTPKDLLLLPSSLIYPIDPILFPFESNNYYINYRKSGVNIISARVSSDYSILFYPKSILNKEQVNEFMKAYYVSLDYFMRVFYNKSYELYDNYQGVVTILILFSTLQRFLNEDSKFNQNYDLLSKEEVELLFSSYGIRNIRNIPKEYLIKLLFNINNLISKKGTDGVFNEIFNIFDIEDINISRYLLTKNLRKHRTKNYYYIDDIQSYGNLIERRIKEPENKGILGNVLAATDFIDTLIGILERRSYDYKTKELVYLKENIFDAMVSRIYGAEVYNPENNETVLVESIYTDYTELIDLFNTIFQYNENSKILFNERMLPNTIKLATDTYKYNLTNYLGELPLLLVYREYEKLSLDYLLFVREF